MIVTGIFEVDRIFIATEPSSTLAAAPRPLDPITSRSAFGLLQALMISSAGRPITCSSLNAAPARRSAARAPRRAYPALSLWHMRTACLPRRASTPGVDDGATLRSLIRGGRADPGAHVPA